MTSAPPPSPAARPCRACGTLLSGGGRPPGFCGPRCLLRWSGAILRRNAIPLLVVWNLALTALLVLEIAIGDSLSPVPVMPPAAAGPAGHPAATDTIQVSPPAAPGPPAVEAVRRELLDRSVYRLAVPVRRGGVVAVWRNGEPLVSRRTPGDATAALDIDLVFGENRLIVGVWDSRARPLYRDSLVITWAHPVVAARRRSLRRGDTGRPWLALTFDGGANDRGARRILEILAARGVVTTMFLTGQFVERYPDLVEDILAAGHEVGNHTYSHPSLTTFPENGRHDTRPEWTRGRFQAELRRTDSLFHDLTGRHMMPYWRAPFGEVNQTLLDWAAELGYRHIRWSRGFDTMDWVDDPASDLYRTPEAVRQAILEMDAAPDGLNGAIVLMHLGSTRIAEPMHTMLDTLIGDLLARGYRPVTVTELLVPEMPDGANQTRADSL